MWLPWVELCTEIVFIYLGNKAGSKCILLRAKRGFLGCSSKRTGSDLTVEFAFATPVFIAINSSIQRTDGTDQ